MHVCVYILHNETANCSLIQLFIKWLQHLYMDNVGNSIANTCRNAQLNGRAVVIRLELKHV